MATFKTQIEDLISSGTSGIDTTIGDDVALNQWLTDGAKEIINVLPRKLKEKCSTYTSVTAASGMDLDAVGEILYVVRENSNSGYDVPCRKIPAMYGGVASDSTNLIYYATPTDPVYWIASNKSDAGKVLVSPSPTANQPASVYHITYPAIVGSDDSVIANFPDEAEYLVVLYASIKGLQRLMNSALSNTLIDNTAFGASSAELLETQAVCDLINTQVDSAVSEIAEAATEVDAQIDTACDAITTAAGRVNTAVGLANAQFDAGVLEAAQAELEADDSAIATALTAINTNIDSAVADIALAKVEAAEIATQTDDSSGADIYDALYSCNQAMNKVDDVIVEASAEFDKVDNVIVEGSAEIDKSTSLLDLGETDTEGAVNTALGAMGTELGETQGVCDSINTNVAAAVTEIAKAVTEAGEMITQTDASSDFATALTAINTAVDNFRASSGDPALFGDETQYETSVGMVHVKDALDKAQNLVDGATMGGDTEPESTQYWLNDEDTEMAQATLSTAQTEIQRAQAHIAEWNATVQALQAEINGFATEVKSRASFTGAKGQTVQSILAEASAYLQASQGFASEIQTKIGIAGGYGQEVQMRLAQAQAKRQESQSRLAAGSAYIQEAQSIVSQGNAYLQEAQAYVAQANGYAQEASARGGFTQAKFQSVQSYINTAGAFIQAAQAFANEVQAYSNSVGIFKMTSENRINLGNAFLAEANASAQEAQTFANEVNARIAQIGGYSQVVSGYLNAASGFASEIQSKIGISQAYIAEANARMQRDSQKYQWYQAQQTKLQEDYAQGVTALIGAPAQPQQQRAQ